MAVVEGNAGTTQLEFPVSCHVDPSSGQSVSVHVATANGTATSGSDYSPVSTTVTWNPGDPVTKYVSVPVTGDTAVEPNETFFLNLSAPSPIALTAISDPQGKATIVTDD
jgi:chitinase